MLIVTVAVMLLGDSDDDYCGPQDDPSDTDDDSGHHNDGMCITPRTRLLTWQRHRSATSFAQSSERGRGLHWNLTYSVSGVNLLEVLLRFGLRL